MAMFRRESLKILDVPQMDPGAPEPQIAADDSSLIFGYALRDADETAAATEYVADGERCAIFTVPLCRCLKFGSPNDEAIAGHRLASVGLRSYGAYEVSGSAWIDELEHANRVHDRHRKDAYLALRHVIFTFHDSTLEFVAERFSWETATGVVGRLVAAALERLRSR